MFFCPQKGVERKSAKWVKGSNPYFSFDVMSVGFRRGLGFSGASLTLTTSTLPELPKRIYCDRMGKDLWFSGSQWQSKKIMRQEIKNVEKKRIIIFAALETNKLVSVCIMYTRALMFVL